MSQRRAGSPFGTAKGRVGSRLSSKHPGASKMHCFRSCERCLDRGGCSRLWERFQLRLRLACREPTTEASVCARAGRGSPAANPKRRSNEMRLFRLICLASLPIAGLAAMLTTAGAAPGPRGPSTANGGVTQAQSYSEPDQPAAAQDDDYGAQDDAASRCAAQFRSFEPDTGYYTTYDGDRVLCPYLQ